MVIEKMAVVVCSRKIFDVDIAEGGGDAPWKNDKSIFDILFYYQSSLVKIIFPPLRLTFHHDPLSFA